MKIAHRMGYMQVAVLTCLCLTAGTSAAALVAGKVTASGSTYGFVGDQLQGGLVGTVGTAGAQIAGGSVSWQIVNSATKAVVAQGDGAQYGFTPSTAGVYLLTARFYVPSTSPAVADWVQGTIRLQAATPSKPIVRVTGPSRVEYAHPVKFTATVTPAFNLQSSSLRLGGVWVLPDGSTVPGDILSDGKRELTWSPPPTAASPTASTYKVSYRAHFEQYEAATTSTGFATTKSWIYKFPTWKMTAAQTSQNAPSGFKFTLTANDPGALSVLDGLTYEWRIQDGMTVVGTPGSTLAGFLYFGGSYYGNVTIRDARGNEQMLTLPVRVGPPPPVKVTMTSVRNSKWTHYPLTMTVTAKISGGTPGDPTTPVTFTLNNAPIAATSAGVLKVVLPEAGQYSIGAQVVTQGGAAAESSVGVLVPEPDIPTCTITASAPSAIGVVAYTGACKSTTGSVVKYNWTLGDRVLGSTNRLYYKPVPGTSTTLYLNGTSDAGLVGSASVETAPQ